MITASQSTQTFEDKLAAILEECAYADNGSPDVDLCFKKIKRLSGYTKWRDVEVVPMVLASLLSDHRHANTTLLKKCVAPPRRQVGLSPAVTRAQRISFLDKFSINNRSLADISWGELPDLITEQERRAKGHSDNAKFFTLLQKARPKSAADGDKIGGPRGLKEDRIRKLAVKVGWDV